MAYQTLLLEKRGNIGLITFNRPDKRNPMDPLFATEIVQAVAEVEKDKEIRALIFTGAGKAFIAGGDIGWIQQGTHQVYEFYRVHDEMMRLFLRMERMFIPIIAAINGYALGGGTEFATACDIRIAAANAQFGVPEVTLGLMPGAGGTARLPRIIGKSRAMILELTGDRIDAQEAYRIGLVDRVVPEGEAVKAAEEMANRIVRNAPEAVRQIKNAIQMGMDMSLEGASEYCQKNCMMTIATRDAMEGTKAWLEKRPAQWQGK